MIKETSSFYVQVMDKKIQLRQIVTRAVFFFIWTRQNWVTGLKNNNNNNATATVRRLSCMYNNNIYIIYYTIVKRFGFFYWEGGIFDTTDNWTLPTATQKFLPNSALTVRVYVGYAWRYNRKSGKGWTHRFS
jgi:hypothetical protein